MFRMRASRPSARCCRSGRSKPGSIQMKSLRRGKLQAAANVFPRARQRGQQGDGADGHRAAFAALHAIVQPDRGGPRGGVLARQGHDLVLRDAGERGGALGRIFFDARREFGEPGGVLCDVIRIVKLFADDDVHHAQRQRGVAARIDEEMLVGRRARAIAAGIDGVEPGAVAARLHDEGPQMHVGAEDVRAPGDDQLGVPELLGFGAVAKAQSVDQADAARRGTDGAVEPGCAQAMKEAPVHARSRSAIPWCRHSCTAEWPPVRIRRRWLSGARRSRPALRPRRSARSGPRPWRRRAAWDRAGGRAGTRAPDSARLCRTGIRA